MRKKDLKSGMIVKTYNGLYYLVLLDTGMEVSERTDKDVLVGINQNGSIKSEGWMALSGYSDSMKLEDEECEDEECEDDCWDIVEVLSTRCAADIGNMRYYTSIWKRPGVEGN